MTTRRNRSTIVAGLLLLSGIALLAVTSGCPRRPAPVPAPPEGPPGRAAESPEPRSESPQPVEPPEQLESGAPASAAPPQQPGPVAADKGASKYALWRKQYDEYRKNHTQEQAMRHMIEVIGRDPDVENVVATSETAMIAVIFKPDRGYHVPIQTLTAK